MRTERMVRLGLVGFALLVVVAIGVAAATSSAAFSTYNGNWEGASGLEDRALSVGATPEVALETAEYRAVSPDETLALVISPERGYAAADLRILEQFVTDGGTLVVAEDVGPHGNAVLEGVGANARFDTRVVRDDRSYAASPAFPVVSPVTSTSLIQEDLVFNYGTAVDPNGATVLAETSEFSYLDTDGDEELDGSERLQSHPGVTIESVGEGTVIAVGDPSVFINAMLTYRGNALFVEALFERHDTVLLDQSHAQPAPPLGEFVVELRDDVFIQLGFGGALVVLVALGELLFGSVLPDRRRGWFGGGRFTNFRSRGGATDGTLSIPTGPGGRFEDRAAVEAYLERRHPSWDRDRVERATNAVLGPQPSSGTES